MPLSTKEINPTKTPDKFYLEDPENEGVFDQPNLDLDPVPVEFPNAIKVLKKKAFDGVVYLAVHAQRTDIWWQKDEDVSPIIVAQAQLVGNVETSPGVWSDDQAFDFGAANLSKTGFGYTAYLKKDIGPYSNVVFGQIWNFEYGNAKQSFYLDIPGEKVKLTWQVRVLKSAIGTDEKQGLRYDVSDYGSNVAHESEDDPDPDWVIHRWTFEPDGFDCPAADGRTPLERFQDRAGLWVDPYLSVDEESTYIDVFCDGFVFRVSTGVSASNIEQIRNADNDTILVELFECPKFIVDSTTWRFGFWGSRVLTVLESIPTRVVLLETGNLEDTWGGTTALTNLDKVKKYFTIYSDRIVVHTEIYTSGIVSIDDVSSTNCIYGINPQTADLTSEVTIYENAGSESTVSDWTSYDSKHGNHFKT